jgi:hypothetical protein
MPSMDRFSCRHRTMNRRHTRRMAGPLSLRKLAIVLKSGISRPVSHISSMLRCVSCSSRRLDWTHRGVVRRPSGRRWIYALEAQLAQIELINKGLNNTEGGVIGPDVVSDTIGQQTDLGPVRAFNKSLHGAGPASCVASFYRGTRFYTGAAGRRPIRFPLLSVFAWAVPASPDSCCEIASESRHHRSLDQDDATFEPLRSFREIPIGRQQRDRFGDRAREMQGIQRTQCAVH